MRCRFGIRKYCRALFFFLLVPVLAFSFSALGSALGASEYVPVKTGDKAPQFVIQGFNSAALVGKKNLLLVFYRGHF